MATTESSPEQMKSQKKKDTASTQDTDEEKQKHAKSDQPVRINIIKNINLSKSYTIGADQGILGGK